MRTVDFFIVGAPKCGTTAMYTYLKSHPEVFFPERKEPHFFGSDLEFHNQPRITFDEYVGIFSDARADQILGDASVFYLLSETAAEELKAYNPDAKIVIMLRNPVDVMHSFHSQRLFNGTEDINSFPEAVAAAPERRAGKRMPPRIGLRQGLFYQDLVGFADQVQRYFDTFPRAQVHVILYEDLLNDLPGCYEKTCKFLGIDTANKPGFQAVNSNKVIRYRWLRDILKSKPRILTVAGRLLVPSSSIRKSLRNAAAEMNMVTKPRVPMDPDVRSRLLRELDPSIAKLEQLLGRDLGAWRNDVSPRNPSATAPRVAL
jgi:hypothetical protein